jgi:D-amino-acid oxidase
MQEGLFAFYQLHYRKLAGDLLDRRSLVKWMALTAATSAVGACTRPVLRPSVNAGARHFARVRVAAERVIRQVVGLRPFRRTGFRVAAESFSDKTLVHNYGHGGGGMSLSWGSADLAATLALATTKREAAVIGCGALGLSTARLLQDRGMRVTIYARDLPPHTTSNIAGAQWTPTTVADSDRRTPAFDAQFVAASHFAHRYFQNLAGPKYGISWRENYYINQRADPPISWEQTLLDDLLHHTPIPAGEHPFTGFFVTHYLSMHIEPAPYLAAVLADFRIAGGSVVVREFPDAQAMTALPEPLIVNCTGLAAGALFNDADVMPIKGQLVVLAPQPEVDYITVGPGGLYMMPRQDGIVLGGTFERGVSTLEPNPVETARILRGQQALFDGMATM